MTGFREQPRKSPSWIGLKPEENGELESIVVVFSKNMRTDEIKDEIDKIRKWEEKIIQKDIKYKNNKSWYDFQQFETKRFSGDSFYTGKIYINES